MKSLVLWVKDRHRVGAAIEFPDTTTSAVLRQALSEALERDRRRRDQKKAGEAFLDTSFNTKLKSATQWEKWHEELNTTLSQIIGVRGVPLTYTIRVTDAANFDETIPYEEAVIAAMTLTGQEFLQDARVVHKIILKNIVEDSDAYTYVKQLIRHRNGRRDIKALRERYSSDASKQAIINSAKKTLKTLCYKNERSFSFEKFSSKMQRAYDELSDNGRAVCNEDIVDKLWERILAPSPKIQMYVEALKVEYQRNPREYKLILQDIAGEVEKETPAAANFGGNRNVAATYTKQGPCPTTGVHASDGSIFIGSYGKDQWLSDSVKEYHSEIIEARKKQGGAPSRTQKRKVNAVKRQKKKLKKLEAKISAAESKVRSIKSEESEAEVKEEDAGNNFGGKRSKAKNKEKGDGD